MIPTCIRAPRSIQGSTDDVTRQTRSIVQVRGKTICAMFDILIYIPKLGSLYLLLSVINTVVVITMTSLLTTKIQCLSIFIQNYRFY